MFTFPLNEKTRKSFLSHLSNVCPTFNTKISICHILLYITLVLFRLRFGSKKSDKLISSIQGEKVNVTNFHFIIVKDWLFDATLSNSTKEKQEYLIIGNPRFSILTLNGRFYFSGKVTQLDYMTRNLYFFIVSHSPIIQNPSKTLSCE